MRILIDTNAYSALMAGDPRLPPLLARADAVLLSPIVIGELLDGFLGGSRSFENREILERFRAKPRTVMVPITDESSERFAQVKHQLRRAGKPIPQNDVWIAASCLEHGAMLVSFDAHFEAVEGLYRWEAGAGPISE